MRRLHIIAAILHFAVTITSISASGRFSIVSYDCFGFILSIIVFLNKAKEGIPVCRGTAAVVTCSTISGTGFLLWRNNNSNSFSFDDTSFIGAEGTLGSINITLSNMRSVSNAMVYTSEAIVKDNLAENKTIYCSDGDVPRSIDILIKSMKKI